MRTIFFLFGLLFFSGLAAQSGQTAEFGSLEVKRGAIFYPSAENQLHHSVLFQKGADEQGGRRPDGKRSEYLPQSEQSFVHSPDGDETPILIRSFEGNPFDFKVPNDNSLAVSKDGKIVSVINASLNCFREDGTLQLAFTLDDMASSLGLNALKFDPRALYDPVADRFIVVFLNGSTDSNSYIVMAFSSSNDPATGWNMYAMPASTTQKVQKADFPAISLSASSLYITANLFARDDDGYRFREGGIWRIDKESAYLGETLNVEYLDSIRFNGRPFFSIFPVNSLAAEKAQSAYFLADYGEDLSNDSIFLMRWDEGKGASQALDIRVLKANQAHFFPPLAKQPGTKLLESNDSRISGAFLMNGEMQFVATTAVPGTGRSGIYHGIITDAEGENPALTTGILQFDSLYAAYPNIALLGEPQKEKYALIVFNYSGAETFPGFGSVFYSASGSYSKMMVLKEGQSSVGIQSAKVNRWGDYTGIQSDYAGSGMAWAAGSYGRANTHKTRIAHMAVPSYNGLFSQEKEREILLYPNPSHNRLQVEFYIENEEFITVELQDLNARTLNILFRDRPGPGKLRLSLTGASLPSGIYFLVLKNEKGRILARKKWIKQ